MQTVISSFTFFLAFLLQSNPVFLPQDIDNNINNEFLGKWKIKNIENTFKKVNSTLYMAETEVTNQQYNYYLADLLQQKNYDELILAKSEKTDWKALLPKELQETPDAQIFKYGHPDSEFAPIQNISYEGAVNFCKWLTAWYLKENTNNRKWKNVIFRLPTEREWMLSASNGKEPFLTYPWGSDKAQNAKGCYLSNSNCIENIKEEISKNSSEDGVYFTVRADTYYPNAIGLYGMSGNVAEMINEKGIAKGGSWKDAPSECTIQSKKMFDKPAPTIGFRVIMEVLN